jgi:fructokinase
VGSSVGVRAGRVVVVGEVLWDLLPSGPRLGGAPANLGICLARLGRPVALVSSVGGDVWGARTREELAAKQREGADRLDVSLLQTAEGVPTGLVEVAVNTAGVPVYTIAQPAAWDRIQATAEAEEAVRGARAVCFGTLAQRDLVSRGAIRRLIGGAGAECLRVLDVTVREPFFSEEVARWSLAHADLVKISEEELDLVARRLGLAGLAGDGVEAIEACGRGVLAAYPGVGLLAITMGSRGSLLVTAADGDVHPGFPVSVVDTVGAGDAFTAGLVHAWLAGGSLRQVNEVGNLCGSFVAGQAGAAPVFSAELLERVGLVLRG